MKKLLFLLFLTASFALSAQSNNVQKFINKELKTDPLFQNAIVGIYAEGPNGKAVAQWNPDMPLLTASTMKTLTTGAALEILGPDFRYKTLLAYSGTITDSILTGNIYIIGGGDPTLGAELPLSTPISEVFGNWTSAIKSLGIKEIDGLVIPDDSYFQDEIIPESWSWGNIGESYGSGTSGLCFYENTQIFFITPGCAAGEPAIIEGCYPEIPGMEYRYHVRTVGEGSYSSTYYYTSDLAKIGNLYGRIALDKTMSTPTFSNKFPHLSCGLQFASFLEANGIACNIKVEDVDDVMLPSADSIFVIDTLYSPILKDIIHETNITSNNLFAETIFKTISRETTGVGCYDSSLVVMERLLEENGVSLTGYTQCDGSGLSRQDYISPRFFCNFYRMMLKSNNFAPYLESFPVPGMAGSTLSGVLEGEDEAIKSRIHAKSGSLANVRCYAGYVETSGEPIRFAILVNNYAARTSQMQPKIEQFMKELSKYAGKK